jgi:hypothetical protein
MSSKSVDTVAYGVVTLPRDPCPQLRTIHAPERACDVVFDGRVIDMIMPNRSVTYVAWRERGVGDAYALPPKRVAWSAASSAVRLLGEPRLDRVDPADGIAQLAAAGGVIDLSWCVEFAPDGDVRAALHARWDRCPHPAALMRLALVVCGTDAIYHVQDAFPEGYFCFKGLGSESPEVSFHETVEDGAERIRARIQGKISVWADGGPDACDRPLRVCAACLE